MTTVLSVPRQMPGKRRTLGATGLTFLVFGPTGSGKSRLGLTFASDPRTAPLLWCDPTAGTNGLLDEAEAHGATVQRTSGLSEIQKMTDYLIAEKGAGFKSIFFDDFSESFNIGKAEVSGAGSTEQMKWESYPQLYERTTNRIRGFLRLAEPVEQGGAGLHVVVACWAEKETDRDGNELWVPQFAGKYGLERVGGYFDIVGFLKKEVKSALVGGQRTRVFTNTLVTLSDKYQVKDRYDVIPNGELERPTATALLDLIEIKRNSNSKGELNNG